MNKYKYSGKTLRVKQGAGISFNGELLDEKEFVAEDYWINITGKSWMVSNGNPACIEYALRTGLNELNVPIDDNVVYGKIGYFGHLFHECELEV